MKILLSFIALTLTLSFVSAQPCKTVKSGMTKPEVTKLAGAPTSIDFLGVDNETDTLALWNYGNQQVVFSGSKVDRVKTDVKKETEMAKEMMAGKMTKEEFKERLEKLDKEGCK